MNKSFLIFSSHCNNKFINIFSNEDISLEYNKLYSGKIYYIESFNNIDNYYLDTNSDLSSIVIFTGDVVGADDSFVIYKNKDITIALINKYS